MQPLAVERTSSTDGADVLLVEGEIDIATAPELRACLASLAHEAVVAVDLSGVAFVESSGIAVLIAEHKRRAAAGEQLVVTGSSPLALRVFEATGVDQLLNLDGDSPVTSP